MAAVFVRSSRQMGLTLQPGSDMLLRLRVKHYLLARDTHLICEEGFTVLTGETGAGKSLLLEALGLLLGRRAVKPTEGKDPELEAVFAMEALSMEATRLLESWGVETEEHLVIRRRLSAKVHRQGAWVNGTSVTVGQLRQLGDILVAVHGQHRQQDLRRPLWQRDFIDFFGGLKPQRAMVAEAFLQLEKARQDLLSLDIAPEEAARHLAAAKEDFQLLNDANCQPGELEVLASKIRNLEREEDRLAHLSTLDRALNDDDEGLLPRFESLARDFMEALPFDSDLQAFENELDGARSTLNSLASTVADHASEAPHSPLQLNEWVARQALLQRLQKRFGPTEEDLINAVDRLKREIHRWEDHQFALEKARDHLKKTCDVYASAAESLQRVREEAGQKLSEALSPIFTRLGMDRAKLVVSVESHSSEPKRWTATGWEKLFFTWQSHPDLPPGPLHKMASGGELSRIMLSLLTLQADADSASTLIFDEVDTGVSGKAAVAVGNLLRGLGTKRQVFAVTHLPTVAAHGHHHWRVLRLEVNGQPALKVETLNTDQRAEELARLSSGMATPEALEHARTLLREGNTSLL